VRRKDRAGLDRPAADVVGLGLDLGQQRGLGEPRLGDQRQVVVRRDHLREDPRLHDPEGQAEGDGLDQALALVRAVHPGADLPGGRVGGRDSRVVGAGPEADRRTDGVQRRALEEPDAAPVGAGTGEAALDRPVGVADLEQAVAGLQRGAAATGRRDGVQVGQCVDLLPVADRVAVAQELVLGDVGPDAGHEDVLPVTSGALELLDAQRHLLGQFGQVLELLAGVHALDGGTGHDGRLEGRAGEHGLPALRDLGLGHLDGGGGHGGRFSLVGGAGVGGLGLRLALGGLGRGRSVGRGLAGSGVLGRRRVGVLSRAVGGVHGRRDGGGRGSLGPLGDLVSDLVQCVGESGGRTVVATGVGSVEGVGDALLQRTEFVVREVGQPVQITLELGERVSAAAAASVAARCGRGGGSHGRGASSGKG
jgi:hypothetical protein